jgi:IS4 transposase
LLINLAKATAFESGRFANMSRPAIVVTEKQSRQLERFAKTGIEA